MSNDFHPNEHLMQIRNKNGASDYLPVQWRLVWFREQCPEGSIETEMSYLDLDRETEEEGYQWNQETRRSEKVIKRAPGFVIFRATVTDGKGGKATATKSEKAASFGDFIEKAETGAVGRALAMLGFGTQFAPELSEEHHIVDAPVVRPASDLPQTTGEILMSQPASPQQIASIAKLRTALALPEEKRDLTYKQAKEAIADLTKEYNERKKAKAS